MTSARVLGSAVVLAALVLTAPTAGEASVSCAGAPPCLPGDYDGDRFKDWADNCPLVTNRKQKDTDGDTGAPILDPGTPPSPVGELTGPMHVYEGTPLQTAQALPTDRPPDRGGDDCDTDDDGDGIWDRRTSGHKGPDNCKLTHNPDQRDSDDDGVGDACDATHEPAVGVAVAKITVKRLPVLRYSEIEAGIPVEVRCTARCRLSARLLSGRRLIGRGAAGLDGTGRTFLVVRIPAVRLRALRARRAPLRATLVVSDGGGAVVARMRLTLRR